MKCKYTFPVKGVIKFPVGIGLSAGDRYYEFIVNDGLVTGLAVTISDVADSCLPDVVSHTEGKIKASITVPPDPHWDDLVSDIRTMEGSLCLWGVDEIDVDHITTEWIPESEEEKKKLKLFSFSKLKEEAPNENFSFSPMDMFVRSTLAISEFKEYETPLNFYRRGRLDVSKKRYIDSISDLYFVLETLFANGKFKKQQVIKEFISSPVLLSAIKHIKSKIDPQIRNDRLLYIEFANKYLNRKEKEIIEHIVELRGFLHHHTLKRKDIWHPAKQREFKIDAISLLNLCHHILSNKIIAVLFQQNRIEEFLRADVKTKDGKKIKWKGQFIVPSLRGGPHELDSYLKE